MFSSIQLASSVSNKKKKGVTKPNGASWSSIISNAYTWGTSTRTAGMDCSNDGTYILAARNGATGVYLSTDAGVSWSQVGSPINANYYVACVGVNSTGQYMLIGMRTSTLTTAGTMYLSSNYGATFTALSLTAQKWNGANISANGAKMFLCYATGFWLSSDYGANWTATTPVSASIVASNMSPSGNCLVYTQTVINGWGYSTNFGSTWNTISTGNTTYNDCDICDTGQCVAGTSDGIFQYYNSSWGLSAFSLTGTGAFVSMSEDGFKIVCGTSTGVYYGIYASMPTSISSLTSATNIPVTTGWGAVKATNLNFYIGVGQSSNTGQIYKSGSQ